MFFFLLVILAVFLDFKGCCKAAICGMGGKSNVSFAKCLVQKAAQDAPQEKLTVTDARAYKLSVKCKGACSVISVEISCLSHHLLRADRTYGLEHIRVYMKQRTSLFLMDSQRSAVFFNGENEICYLGSYTV